MIPLLHLLCLTFSLRKPSEGGDGANGSDPRAESARRLLCAVVLRAWRDARAGGSDAVEARRWLREFVGDDWLARVGG
jgi:hypothetical protein